MFAFTSGVFATLAYFAPGWFFKCFALAFAAVALYVHWLHIKDARDELKAWKERAGAETRND